MPAQLSLGEAFLTSTAPRSDPEAFMMNNNNPGGPTMLFATLTPKQPNGGEWDTDAIEFLGAQWKEVSCK